MKIVLNNFGEFFFPWIFLCQGGPKDFVFSQKKLSPKVAQFCEKKNWNFLTLTPTFLHLHEEEEVAKLEKKLSKTCLSSFLTAFEKKNFFDNKNFKGEPKRKKNCGQRIFFSKCCSKTGKKIILNNFGKKKLFRFQHHTFQVVSCGFHFLSGCMATTGQVLALLYPSPTPPKNHKIASVYRHRPITQHQCCAVIWFSLAFWGCWGWDFFTGGMSGHLIGQETMN